MVLKKLKKIFFLQCSCWGIMLLNRINLPWYFVITNIREKEGILQCDSQLKSANSALWRMVWKGTNNKITFYLHGSFFGICIRKNVISPVIEMQPFQSGQDATIPYILRLKAEEPLSGRMKSLLWKSVICNSLIIFFDTDQEFSSSFWKWILFIDNSY